MKFPHPAEPVMRDNLAAIIGALAEAQGVSTRTICRKIAFDDRFLIRLEDGSSVTARVYDQVIARCAALWPPGFPWPPKVERPSAAFVSSIVKADGRK